MTAPEDRIRALPCWSGRITVERLHGGLSNENFVVADAAGKHVARLGADYPFHHVDRAREAMTARAAHAAGFGPKVEYAGPGVMVCGFVEGKALTGDEVRAQPERIARLLHGFHHAMPYQVSGAAFLFWVFHVIRDYARLLQAGGHGRTAELPRYLALADELEKAQAPLPLVFGHNDLLPANLIDDGERLWLIDYEYAGFNTALFDLSGIASNAGMDADESGRLLAAYLGHAPDVALLRAHAAMQCASLLREAMWGMVSELHLAAPGADYGAYAAQNLALLDAALDRYRSSYGTPPS